MLHARIVSILFCLTVVCGLLVLEFYQTHGPVVLTKSSCITAMVMVFALTRALYALIQCVSRCRSTSAHV